MGCRSKYIKIIRYFLLLVSLLVIIFLFIPKLYRESTSIKLFQLQGIKSYQNRGSYNHLLETQEDRQERLKFFCKKYRQKVSNEYKEKSVFLKYPKIKIYNEKYKALYCAVPKAACTTWKGIFQMFEGNFKKYGKDKVHELDYNYFISLPFNLQQQYFRTHFSFLFSRHPLDRLLATYRNKFLNPFNDTRYRDIYTKKILQTFRSDSLEIDYEHATISFNEFLKYILSETTVADLHWSPMYLLCQLCFNPYKYLGKHETLEQDSEYIFKILNVSNEIQFPKQTKDYNTKTLDLMKMYYNRVPSYLMKDLYKYVQYDLEAFGYDFNEYF